MIAEPVTGAITCLARLEIIFTSGKNRKSLHAPLRITACNAMDNVPSPIARFLR